ncbi:hypothetical protein [Methylobacterium pseudosasicola]|uniref:Exosortase/archaeosortase family protein n=1 Tax=Methylobacterium pseudosasicola TaxID=582667 RepID=A0A1I4RKD8_9HYPH|nr:hypothetical protein [Methylobacterium pseudosasicola]SFM52664.1 hypothetical protein SAMN05192568_103626 [Methylobacterium pseudosasicola]
MVGVLTRCASASLIGRARALTSFLAVHAASWSLLVFSAGTVLSAVLQRHLLEETQTTQHLVEFNVGESFGLAAILSLMLSDAHERPTLARSDVAVLLLSALTWFVPEQHGVYLAMTLAGAWFLLKSRSDPRMVGIGQIWLALSVYELWGKLLFKIAYQAIEVVEVGLIYQVGRLFYGGLGVSGASLSVRSDWSIVILEGCSSFHNLSLTVLIWLSILKIAEQPALRAAFRALGVSACLVVAINVSRLLLMLPSREAFIFWHDGAGSSLVALASVVAAIAPILTCVEGRTCQPSPRT